MRIANRVIGPGQPPFIVAEIGVNHDGSVSRALELVDAAGRARADAVKLQCFDADRLLSGAARLAVYQRRTGSVDPHGMLRACQLDESAMEEIAARAQDLDLRVILTVYSVDLVDSAARLAVDAFKTASPDVVNRPLIEALIGTGKPLLVSAGTATPDEIRDVTQWLGDHPHLLMQCVSAYPTPDDCASLGGRAAMCRINPRALGYSDHTTAIDTGALAVASGACILEKHLTHDRTAAGPDHATSLDPPALAEYVRLAHRAWRMLGPPVKRVLEVERDVREASRQSLTTTRALPAGHVLSGCELTIKRPGTGIAPWRMSETVGRRLQRAVDADVPLRDEDLQ